MNSIFAVAGDRHNTSAGAALRGIGSVMLSIFNRAVAARQRARTMQMLSGLDDASLKDIGLTRGQIDAVERDPRYSPRFPGF
jgi:uncharacterized protein YjiS (DUF1127 family)